MIGLVQASLKLNRMWINGTRKIATVPEYQQLLKCFPLSLPTSKIMSQFPKRISIKTFYIHQGIRISIYMIPKGKTMLPHDHPDMFVFGNIMEGKAKVTFYTHVKGDLYQKEQLEVSKNQNLLIEDGSNNIHEFKALQNTLLLDVLFPDYDDSRPGTFYKEVGEKDGLCVLKEDHDSAIELEEFEW